MAKKKPKSNSIMARHVAFHETPRKVEIFPPRTGKERYTAARFLSDCCEETESMLRAAWREGDQLIAGRVPVDGLPVVVILACYARDYGVDLVDDYDLLIQRYRENVAVIFHNDKFFASCICLLAERYQSPSIEAYESINVPGIYEELLG